MNRLPAAAFLSLALLAPRAGHAQVWNEETKSYDYVDDKGNVQGSSAAPDKPADKPADKPGEASPEKPAGEAAGGDAKYGTFALDASGNKITGEALSKLPPEAQWAMKEKGYSPVLGPNGEVLGYDNGMMCILPHAVAGEFALANPGKEAAPTVTAQDAAVDADKGRQQADAQAAGRVPKEGDLDFVGPLSPGFCAANPSAPACAGDKKEEEKSPEDIAAAEKSAAEKKAADAVAAGDRDAAIAALNKRNAAEDRMTTEAGDVGGNKGGRNGGFGFSTFGGPGGGLASDGPAPRTPSGGGAPLGQEGRVGGDGDSTGGGIAGKQVRASAEQEADAMLAFKKGMDAGPLEGDSDPNVQSVAQVANRGLGGRAMDAARSLFSTLSENLGVAADSPETDLTDQLATNPIDGAAANRAPIKVVECRKDTLDGAAGGRTSRKIGGC